MGLRPEVGELRTGEHDDSQASSASEEPVSLARETPAEAVAAIKRELAALLVVGAAGLPLAAVWLDGAREFAALGGYGLGAALWVHARARGLLYAAGRGRRREDADGA